MEAKVPSPEERLNRLEEQLYFQERTIAELNRVLIERQAQADELERRLALAEDRLRALLPLLEEGGEQSAPPHYGQRG